MQQTVTVLILPPSLQKDALISNHDAPTAGHLGTEKTLKRLCHDTFWINMAKDVEKYCRQCPTCQQSELPMPQRGPLQEHPCWTTMAGDS